MRHDLLATFFAAAVCTSCASGLDVNADAGDRPTDVRMEDASTDAPEVSIGWQLESEVNWSGSAPITLGTVDNRMCFLTSVTGSFDANAEVKVYASGAMWYVAGSGAVRAAARCLTWLNGGPAVSGPHDWAQGQAPVAMGAEVNRLCGLTRMAGPFRGGGEVIRTSVEAGTWTLGGGSLQSGVAASAHCLAWPAAPGLSLSAEVSWEQGQAPRDLGGGNRACLLTMITGSYRGLGEEVAVRSRGAGWQLTGSSQQSGLAARSRCLAY